MKFMIDYEAFLAWVEQNFSEVSESNGEIKVNSIFCDDSKSHLWINPHKNAYHCWKSDKSGNLFDLVCKVSGCSYHEAVETISDVNPIRSLEAKVEKMYAPKEEVKVIVKESDIKFPPNTFEISKLQNEFLKNKIRKYLEDRKLEIGNLLYCISGEYYGRIIIPYYDKEGKLIYWNARTITNSSLRYRGPDKKIGVGKGDVLYLQTWPKSGDKIYLTEGEFDAMSLNKCGVYGGACGGKNLSDKQIELLKEYNICLCFDSDNSGTEALNKNSKRLFQNRIEMGIKEISFVRTPLGCKDWNEMLCKYNEKVINLYIKEKEKLINQNSLLEQINK